MVTFDVDYLDGTVSGSLESSNIGSATERWLNKLSVINYHAESITAINRELVIKIVFFSSFI